MTEQKVGAQWSVRECRLMCGGGECVLQRQNGVSLVLDSIFARLGTRDRGSRAKPHRRRLAKPRLAAGGQSKCSGCIQTSKALRSLEFLLRVTSRRLSQLAGCIFGNTCGNCVLEVCVSQQPLGGCDLCTFDSLLQ